MVSALKVNIPIGMKRNATSSSGFVQLSVKESYHLTRGHQSLSGKLNRSLFLLESHVFLGRRGGLLSHGRLVSTELLKFRISVLFFLN